MSSKKQIYKNELGKFCSKAEWLALQEKQVVQEVEVLEEDLENLDTSDFGKAEGEYEAEIRDYEDNLEGSFKLGKLKPVEITPEFNITGDIGSDGVQTIPIPQDEERTFWKIFWNPKSWWK